VKPANDSRRPARFGAFELDYSAGELRKGGMKLRLHGQPFQVLALLLEKTGQVVTRDEIRQSLWPADTFVDFDNGLNTAINKIREALCDSADKPRFIETLPRRGYRFLVQVENLAPQVPSLAVLPLENLSGDPNQEYFADGLTEALITNLAKISALRVVSRTTAMHYKCVHRPIPEIGRELGVDMVVEGTVQRSGDRVRISAQLIQAAADTHVWAESYDRDLRDILALQSEVARAIAREMRIKLTAIDQARLPKAQSVEPEAYEAYLRGRYYWNKRSGDALTKGAQCFQQAIDRDPAYAAGYSGLADCASSAGWFGFLPPDQAFGKGKALALKAIELDPALPEAHASLAWALTHYDFDFLAAEREYERSIEVDPRYATARQWFGLLLMPLGRFDEAFAELKRAVRLDPASPIINATFAWIHLYARRYAEACTLARKTLELDPAFGPALYPLGFASVLNNMHEDGIAAFEKAVVLSPDGTTYLAGLGWAYAHTGRIDQARTILHRLMMLSETQYVMAINMALIYVAMHENDEAIRWLETAFRERSPWIIYLKTDPRYDRLRSDPRFQGLVRRMNFPDV
jgi:TolB-like protein/Flp pilus assembly protein TadD